MNCRNFTAEFEERGRLSESAQIHLNDCPDCRKFSGEQTRVWQMIDGLRRMDAPKNFDFLVRARIANAKPEKFQSKFLPVLRYVLPVSLVVLVLGIFAFNTTFFLGGSDAPQVAEINPATPIVAEKQVENPAASEQPVAVVSNSAQSFTDEKLIAAVSNQNTETVKVTPEAQFISAKSANNLSPKPRRTTPKNNFNGGSRTSASTSAPVLTPENLNANKTVENLPDDGSQNTMIAGEEIWAFLGIEIVRENGKRTVKAVKQNSYADRSGVKTGDVIEAIDGAKLSAKPIRTKKIEVKKLKVVRGAETIEITLQN